MTTLCCFLCSSRDDHRSVASMIVTLKVLWYLCRTYLAARLCTVSIFSILDLVYGSQNDGAYSRIGHIMDVYEIIFSCEVICKFRLRNARLLFALFTVLSMCLFHKKSNVKLMPRYLMESTSFFNFSPPYFIISAFTFSTPSLCFLPHELC